MSPSPALPLSPSLKSPRRRKWIRVSLRSLLMLMLLAAIYVAGWVSGRRSVQPQGATDEGTNSADLGTIYADFDQDGQLDIFISNGAAPGVLLRDQGDGTFVETR